mgnify:CR=1 FL=1
MVSQILDAEIVFKGRKLPVLNSEMNIKAEWDIDISKYPSEAGLSISCKSISGSFCWEDRNLDYSRRTTITFSTSTSVKGSDWKIEVVKSSTNLIEDTSFKITPESAVIDFDLKNIKIKF